MGMISKIIGLVLSAAGAVILFFGMNGDPTYSYVLFFVGLMVMFMGFSLISGGRKPAEQEAPPPTVTEIQCNNKECDFKEIREFEKGDYILKPVDAKCPKCSQKMTIEGVYIVKEDKDADKYKV
jgi:hypothetical protein